MHIDRQLQRAEMLLNINKIDDAIAELKQVLSIEPQNTHALLLLVDAYTRQKKTQDAIAAGFQLVSADPNNFLGHFFISLNFITLHNTDKAEHHAYESLHLNPNFAATYALLSHIAIHRKQFEKALDFAEQGLYIEPEELLCLNVRTEALTKLGRTAEAAEAAANTLAADPNDAYSHTNIGWAKLEANDYKAAKMHFVEALRLNPTEDNARLGLLESLKAQNIFYRFFLYYFFLIARKVEKSQALFIVILWVGTNILGSYIEENILFKVLYYLLITFAYLTWIIKELFNFTLCFDAKTRIILSSKEKKAAYVAGISVILGLLCLGLLFYTNLNIWFVLTITLAAWIIPFVKYLSAESDFLRKRTRIFAISLSITGILSILTLPFYDSLILNIHIYTAVAFQFIYNYWLLKNNVY